MRFTRKTRLTAALIALISVLFMQLAVAAYACVGGQSSDHAALAMPSSAGMDEGMSGCKPHDSAQPALCHAHCQDGKLSLDKADVPVHSAVLTAVLTVAPFDPQFIDRSAAAYQRPLLARAISPPLSIRNCCFRI